VTDTLTRPDLEAPVLADGDPGAHPSDLTHIVMDPDRERDDPGAYMQEARVNGTPVTALCGWTWIPHRDPLKLPLCTKCKAIYEHDPNGFGDRGDLPDAG
jgi:hypothetical protein